MHHNSNFIKLCKTVPFWSFVDKQQFSFNFFTQFLMRGSQSAFSFYIIIKPFRNTDGSTDKRYKFMLKQLQQ